MARYRVTVTNVDGFEYFYELVAKSLEDATDQAMAWKLFQPRAREIAVELHSVRDNPPTYMD